MATSKIEDDRLGSLFKSVSLPDGRFDLYTRTETLSNVTMLPISLIALNMEHVYVKLACDAARWCGYCIRGIRVDCVYWDESRRCIGNSRTNDNHPCWVDPQTLQHEEDATIVKCAPRVIDQWDRPQGPGRYVMVDGRNVFMEDDPNQYKRRVIGTVTLQEEEDTTSKEGRRGLMANRMKAVINAMQNAGGPLYGLSDFSIEAAKAPFNVKWTPRDIIAEESRWRHTGGGGELVPCQPDGTYCSWILKPILTRQWTRVREDKVRDEKAWIFQNASPHMQGSDDRVDSNGQARRHAPRGRLARWPGHHSAVSGARLQ